jgi:hypothetical protein
MVVGKAFCRLFQLPHLSHGEHASGGVVVLATPAGEEKDEDINVTAAGGLALSPD